MTSTLTRRGAFAAIGASGVACTFSATLAAELRAAGDGQLAALIARHDTMRDAMDRYRGPDGSSTERAYLAAVDALDAYKPRTSAEFVEAFAVRFEDDMMPTDEDMARMVQIACQLAGRAAT